MMNEPMMDEREPGMGDDANGVTDAAPEFEAAEAPDEDAVQPQAADEPDDESADAEPSPDDALAQARREHDALNDRHLRLAAEFNNFRRRTEAERLEMWARAQADLLERLLETLDDLHRVADLDLTNATVEAIMEGIDMVEKKFVRVLADAGLEMIDPVGEPFDPERMEAMMRLPAESEDQDDVVAQVFQKGAMLKGILVRPARVSVHKFG